MNCSAYIFLFPHNPESALQLATVLKSYTCYLVAQSISFVKSSDPLIFYFSLSVLNEKKSLEIKMLNVTSFSCKRYSERPTWTFHVTFSMTQGT